jgi:membrane-associated phospholipid phosphatase
MPDPVTRAEGMARGGSGSEIEHNTVRRPRALLLWGGSLLMLFLLLAFAIGSSPSSPFTQPLDDTWREHWGVGPNSGAYTWILPMFFQNLGEILGLLVILVTMVVLFAVGRWRSALYVVLAFLAAMPVLATTTKNIVDRPRPAPDVAHQLYGPLFRVDHGSFPSGHCVTVAVIAVGALALIPAWRRRTTITWRAIAVLLMVGMPLQRTLVNAHWLSDTIAGLIAGTAATFLVQWALWPLICKDHGRPIWFLAHGGRPKARDGDPDRV